MNALIVFVRNPESGKVKTRLAAQIGNEKALAIYIKLLHHTRDVAEKASGDHYVFATGPLMDDTWKDFTVAQQSEGDLGRKMKQAFDYLFNKGYKNVVIIGSDCPALTTDHINNAFATLKTHDVVIGPANDGGYYLLGMKKLHMPVFEKKQWSTASVLTETIASLNHSTLTYKLLETLTDVDEKNDLPDQWKHQFNVSI